MGGTRTFSFRVSGKPPNYLGKITILLQEHDMNTKTYPEFGFLGLRDVIDGKNNPGINRLIGHWSEVYPQGTSQVPQRPSIPHIFF